MLEVKSLSKPFRLNMVVWRGVFQLKSSSDDVELGLSVSDKVKHSSDQILIINDQIKNSLKSNFYNIWPYFYKNLSKNAVLEIEVIIK